jgi:hypothetical protein
MFGYTIRLMQIIMWQLLEQFKMQSVKVTTKLLQYFTVFKF